MSAFYILLTSSGPRSMLLCDVTSCFLDRAACTTCFHLAFYFSQFSLLWSTVLSLALSMRWSFARSFPRLASGAFRGCFGRLGLCTFLYPPAGCVGLGAGIDDFMTERGSS
ncbi:uncharacterized protein BO88DRAFT_187318 [Aspergillus vadensis CBS 113365]|uniref:Uncharacterized protein n=1 Tax=Aspergillus vadensis (strain CBS 113365 / IMI 142717 / IBT 24658) TaxID=1448311 RepID=A0A319AXD4_ASPVC|nr:hypothetical protein BO88DRAFT_187318 [Aspergillus vadensis CBS 113365]PYH64061.1 hypothetical protein BO88DRAFT_187318 [Aspergillus vadensis CBS 113365]